ncbi:MAG TPA: hypothetical protein PKA58_11155 [Polyangium sp.]|nr:hypothetical protein [Polyangium sp.]
MNRTIAAILVGVSFAALPLACSSTTGTSSSNSGGAGGSNAGGNGNSSSGGQGGDLFPSVAASSSGNGSSSGSNTTSSGSVLDAGLEDFCAGNGVIPIPGTNDCTSDIGKKVFLFAMCSCTSITSQNTINTDSVDAAKPGMPLAGGSVGVNGNYTCSAPNDIQGALIVGGAFSAMNTHNVVQNMTIATTSLVGAPATAKSDAYLGAEVTGPPKNLTISGKMYTPLTSNVNQVNGLGGFSITPVNVAPPCDCTEQVDIAGIVDAFKGTNDNLTNMILTDALTTMPNYPKDITIPCGRYFFDGIEVNNPVTLHLTGRTVIAIGGNINVSGPLNIELAEGAELDMFVTGTVFLNNLASIGSKTSPKSTRIYIAGNDVTMTGQLTLSANFYLPNAVFNITNDLEMWGALFAKQISSSGKVKVHYDEGILKIPGCQGGDEPCKDCGDCVNPNPSCGADGTCGPCTKNEECCAPLICNAIGECVPPPPK